MRVIAVSSSFSEASSITPCLWIRRVVIWALASMPTLPSDRPPGRSLRKCFSCTAFCFRIGPAGQLGFSGDGGPATQAQLYSPGCIAVDAAGNLCIAEISASASMPSTVTVPMTLTAGSALPAALSVQPPGLSFSMARGGRRPRRKPSWWTTAEAYAGLDGGSAGHRRQLALALFHLRQRAGHRAGDG